MNTEVMVSPYLHLFKSLRHGFLAYNGINNSFMRLNAPLFDCLKKAETDRKVLEELDRETYTLLKKNRVLCTQEEVIFFKTQKKFLRNLDTFQHQYLTMTIAPTTSCNFSCPYCFEKGIKYKTMNQTTIDNLVLFIKERSAQTRNTVGITWYGGEPLLAINQIQDIYYKLIENKINIAESSMITNGYYLTSENQDILHKLGVSSIQITLDGSNALSHNKRRFTKDNKGSWDIILSNIDLFLQKPYDIMISLRCNLDKINEPEYNELVKKLNKRWNNSERIFIHPAILRNHGVDENMACRFFSDKEANDYLLKQKVREKNLSYFEYTIGGCSATQLNSYLVGPEGEYYKCWNDLGRKEKIVGSVNDENILNQQLLFQYLVDNPMFEDKKCANCKLFFVCDGGCQWERLKDMEAGRQNNSCHFAKENLEKYLEEYFNLKKERL